MNFSRLDDLIGLFARSEFDSSMNADVLEVIKTEIQNRDAISGRLYKTEQTLSQLKTIFDQSPMGMAIVGNDNKFIVVNPALCTMLGYAEGELLNVSFDTITFAEDRVLDLHLARRLWSGDLRSYNIEKRYVCKDGRVILVRLTATGLRPIPGQQRRGIALIDKLEDCGPNGARATGLGAPADAAIAASDAGTWQWEPQTGAMAWCSFLDNLLGYPHAELKRNWLEFRTLIHAEDARAVSEALTVHAEGKTGHFEAQFRIRHNDGSYRWLSLRGKAVMNSEGKPNRVIGLAMRIAPPRQVETAEFKSRSGPTFVLEENDPDHSHLACTRCGSEEVAPSRGRWWDAFYGGLFRRAFRCRHCGRRFYRAGKQKVRLVDVKAGG
jgi:PAS domain S-box-containing protein